MENWIDCYGWEGFYEVSDMGNVRSVERIVQGSIGLRKIKSKQLKKIIASTGYEVVNLSKNNIKKQESIHRLVLLSFSPMPKEKKQVCHGNGVRSDNRLCNLRWGDAKENSFDRIIHGTNICGELSPNAKLTENQAKIIKTSKDAVRKLARNYWVSRAAIKAIKTNKTWKHVS